jgi:HEAT repeat protein
MLLRILGGCALAAVLFGLGWQQRTIRQMQSELAGLAEPNLPAVAAPVESDPAGPGPESELNSARAEGQALQLRIIALEAQVQALASELEQELKRQRELAARNVSTGSAPAAELKEHLLDTNRGLKERFSAFRALVRRGLIDAQTTVSFVDEIVARNDDELTAELFGALDNTGNLAAAPALIKGLQSDKVELRMRALDALSEMQSDATVVQWLQHVARTDTEERVRAEAVRVLAQAGNQP